MSLATTSGPIATGVVIQRVEIGPMVIEGDVARADEASIFYVTHFAPGTWNVPEVPGVTSCRLDFRQSNGVWRVVDGACNVSGG